MSNRIFLIIIGLSILTAFIGIILANTASENETIQLGSQMFDYGMRIGSFVGLILLMVNGTFVNTIYFKIVLGLNTYVIIGVLIKIMHWSYADFILISGMISIASLYSFYFFKKPRKTRLDYFKLIWVFVSYTSVILGLMNMIELEFTKISNYLLWLAIIDFAVTKKKNGTLFKT